MKYTILSLLVLAAILAIVLVRAWLATTKHTDANNRFIPYSRRFNKNPRTMLSFMRFLLSLCQRGIIAVLRFYSEKVRYRDQQCFANIAEGEHEGGRVTLLAGAAITRFTFVKRGADSNHVIACAAVTDNPIGIAYDQADAAEDVIQVVLIGGSSDKTLKVVANYIGTMGDFVQTDGTGLAILLASTGFASGRLAADSVVGDVVEIIPVLSTLAKA